MKVEVGEFLVCDLALGCERGAVAVPRGEKSDLNAGREVDPLWARLVTVSGALLRSGFKV